GSREDHNWDMRQPRITLHAMAQLHPTDAGQIQIKEDDIGFERQSFLVSLFSIVDPVAAPALAGQKLLDKLPQGDVVINHQKSSFHGTSSLGPVYPWAVTCVLSSCKYFVNTFISKYTGVFDTLVVNMDAILIQHNKT